MKTLLLLRHAKSSWNDPDLQDFERPLNPRGRRAAPLIGRFMLRQEFIPDLILCSPAERTRQTISLIIEAAHLTGELRYDERIYEASAETLFEVVSQVEDRFAVLLLVGHNPGMEDLLTLLSGETGRMPTAALAALTFDTEKWGKVKEHKGHLKSLTTPKDLPDY
jgi:phosphohistidine phosphatase